jgi:localization factor PodJL
MRSAPWHVKGIPPGARETAREAARRSGVSVGQWLNSVIGQAAAQGGAPAHPAPAIAPAHSQPKPQGEGIASIKQRLDDLGRQLDRLAQRPAAPPVPDDASRRIADAILKLNGRLDQVISEGRDASSALEQRVNSVDRALANLTQERLRASTGFARTEVSAVDQVVAEIAARQRALDGDFATPPPPPPPVLPPAPQLQPRPVPPLASPPPPRLADYAPMQCRAETAVEGLRKDLAEIARALADAMPRRAVEALETEVRTLAGRLDSERRSGVDASALAGIEQGLREVRDALHGLAPAESLVGFDKALKILTGKVDQIATGRQDPAGLQQLEAGIASLRDVMGQVASSDALAALAHEVRGLAERFEHGVPVSNGAEIFDALDQRIGAIADAIEDVRRQAAQAPQAVHVLPSGEPVPGGYAAEQAAQLDHLIRALGDKIEHLQAAPVESPARGEQLDQLIHLLADKVEHLQAAPVESQARSEQLDYLIRLLGEKIEHLQVGPVGSSSHDDQLNHLIRSLGDKIEHLQAGPVESSSHGEQLDHLIRSLGDKIEHLHTAPVESLSRGEQLALGGLEDRIAKLVEKLDASESRLGHLEAIERGMAELLVHLDNLRTNGVGPRSGNADVKPAADEVLSHDVAALKQAQTVGARRTEDSLEVVHGTIETVVDRIAAIETDLRRDPRVGAPTAPVHAPVAAPAPSRMLSPPPPPPAPPTPPPPAARAALPARSPAAPRPQIDAALPPDHPLEPGSGPPRVRPSNLGANAAERIAASEASLRGTGAASAAREADAKSNYLQAARRAAQYAAQNVQRGDAVDTAVEDPAKLGGKLAHRLKAIFVGISVAVLIVVALRFAVTYFQSADLGPIGAPALAERQAPAPAPAAAPRPVAPQVITPPAAPVNPVMPAAVTPTPSQSVAPSAGVLGPEAPSLGPLAPSAPTPPAPQASPAPLAPAAPAANADTTRDVTGSIAARPAPAAPAVASPAAPAPLAALIAPVLPAPILGPTAPPPQAATAPVAKADQLPAGIGGKVLVAAAASGEPNAAYEIATRFAEGRGVPRNFQEAAAWYERAARAGIAPALFRLGALYEKGNGVTKNLSEARRLYLAAAEKGNANAMHNIGVLYAEGIDGKPDFKAAAQWFRKSAALGVSDSQYNLAVLYARGIGIDRDLGVAYQWFALAAKAGDADAAKKRDEIGARLDATTLAAVRKQVDSWVAEKQPTEAVSVPAPSGGWDQAEAAAPPKPKPRAHATSNARSI